MCIVGVGGNMEWETCIKKRTNDFLQFRIYGDRGVRAQYLGTIDFILKIVSLVFFFFFWKKKPLDADLCLTKDVSYCRDTVKLGNVGQCDKKQPQNNVGTRVHRAVE